MKALRLKSWKSQPVLEDVPVPEPGPGEVVIQVGAAGACHSDLHLMHDFDAGTLPWGPPFTLGHENAGWVHATGSRRAGSGAAAQPVAVVGAWGCGTCAHCRDGLETYCERPDAAPVPGGGGGLGLDGGMAEYLLVPAARHLVPLPDGLDPVQAAPLTDAGLTPYHAVRRSASKLGPDGDGGGHRRRRVSATWPCRSCAPRTGARVVAVDPREARARPGDAVRSRPGPGPGTGPGRRDPRVHRQRRGRRRHRLRRLRRDAGAGRRERPPAGRHHDRRHRRRHAAALVLRQSPTRRASRRRTGGTGASSSRCWTSPLAVCSRPRPPSTPSTTPPRPTETSRTAPSPAAPSSCPPTPTTTVPIRTENPR